MQTRSARILRSGSASSVHCISSRFCASSSKVFLANAFLCITAMPCRPYAERNARANPSESESAERDVPGADPESSGANLCFDDGARLDASCTQRRFNDSDSKALRTAAESARASRRTHHGGKERRVARTGGRRLVGETPACNRRQLRGDESGSA